MIWIHGGGFVQTSANMYDGAYFAASHDIVVVTINYRLGVFGFVNFGSLPGGGGIESNLGLRDQIAAMEWVRDNIAGFGGDLNKVTLAGQSHELCRGVSSIDERYGAEHGHVRMRLTRCQR
jgi:para-nitrobenzyl esterase